MSRPLQHVVRARCLSAVIAVILSFPGLANGGVELERVPRAMKERAGRAGGVSVIVQLDVPAPLAAVRGTERRQVALRAAAITAARSRLLRTLSGSGSAYRVTREYTTIPFVAMQVGSEGLAQLTATASVVRVFEDRRHRLALAESVPLVEAPSMWEAGYDGAGWVVAVLDSGIDRSHPMLVGRVVDEACFSREGDCPNGNVTQTGAGAASTCMQADECAHGTYVAAIVSGHGTGLSGVAPGARILAVKVTSRASDGVVIFESDELAALEYIYSVRDRFDVAAANLSLSGRLYASQAACDEENPALKAAVDTLRAADIATIAAAGNDSTAGKLGVPACLSSVVSVGCTTDTDAICSDSNSAPFLSLWAPGADITSAYPGGGLAMGTGSSASTAHVSGAWAILKQLSPQASVDEVLASLRDTGVSIAHEEGNASRLRIRYASKALVCGNGRFDPDEECDDGNRLDGDACNADCTRPTVPMPCVGDCDANGDVMIDDVLKMVGVANGAPLAVCRAGDANMDETIDVGEIIEAVNNSLSGCSPM